MSNTDSKVFMIIGKSFSGKDTLLNKILSDKEFCEKNNLERLVRYTTRKPRPGEVDGAGYHFISDEEYKEKYENNKNAVVTSFNSEYGNLHYIINLSDLESEKNYVVDADPKYVPKLKEKLGDRFCLIYLLPPDWVLFERFSRRADNSEYDGLKYKEIHRRYIDDLMMFGKKSNVFLANCNSIILVGKDYNYSIFKYYIRYFINKNSEAMFKMENVTITKDFAYPLIDTKYDPDHFYSISDIESIMKGEIMFCNGGVIIDTNEEKVSLSKNMI